MRIILFLLTNLAVMAVLLISTKLLGIDAYLGSNYNGLLLFALLLGMGGSFISLLLSKTLAIRSMGVRLLTPEDLSDPETYWLAQTIATISQDAGIKVPDIGIYEGTPNAFATGYDKDNALVAVSTGLLHIMDKEELEGVLAHEIGHIANGDMVTLSLLQGVINALIIFLARVIGSVIDKAVFKNRDGYGITYYLFVFVAEMVLGVVASMIVMWFSRYREYRADEASAALVGTDKMVKALKRLQSLKENPALPKEMAAFGISGNFSSLFSSHPPLDKRIENLLGEKRVSKMDLYKR